MRGKHLCLPLPHRGRGAAKGPLGHGAPSRRGDRGRTGPLHRQVARSIRPTVKAPSAKL